MLTSQYDIQTSIHKTLTFNSGIMLQFCLEIVVSTPVAKFSKSLSAPNFWFSSINLLYRCRDDSGINLSICGAIEVDWFLKARTAPEYFLLLLETLKHLIIKFYNNKIKNPFKIKLKYNPHDSKNADRTACYIGSLP